MVISDFLSECHAFGAALPTYTVTCLGQYFNVFRDRNGDVSSWPCVTRVYAVEGISSSRKPSHHNVIVAYYDNPAMDGPEMAIWCGDGYFEGIAHDATQRRSLAIDFARAHFPGLDEAALRAELSRCFGEGRASTGCNFWFRHAKGAYCKHTAAVMQRIDQSVVDEMRQAWDSVMSPGGASIVPAPSTIEQELARSAFVAPVLLMGPPSTGKTHLSREFAASQESALWIEYGCHEGTEPTDLLGFYGPFESGWVWRDGPVSQAFRKARGGQRVVLVLDELLRIRGRHLTPLLTAFSETHGQYRLRTGRILSVDDGVGQEETLVVDASLIAIVATTNIGAQFDMDAMDPAIKSRFRMIYMDGPDSITRAIPKAIAARGWPDSAAQRLLRLHGQTEKSARSGVLKMALDLRALRRAIAMATTEGELRSTLWGERLQCVGLDAEGRPIAEQEEHYGKILEKAFA